MSDECKAAPTMESGGRASGTAVLGSVLYLMGELLSPTRCASCEKPGELICEDCLRSMTRIDPAHACLRCGAPFGELVCTECQGVETALDRCLAATVFEGPPSRIVRAYKDGGERRLAHQIAHIMVHAARDAEDEGRGRYRGLLNGVDAVTFVPVTAAAYRRRGFDHMESIAREFARACGLPLLDVLVKHGAADQREFTREQRLAQSWEAYEVVGEVRGARLLLLDDVITTGATMDAVAAALKRAGAVHIDGLSFARVW